MKKNILILGIAALLASCNAKFSIFENGQGGVSLSLSTSDQMNMVKSSEAEVDVNKFLVTIKNIEKNELVYSKLFGDVESIINLPVGDYKITAGSTDVKPVAFNQPIYSASQNFSISVGRVSPVALKCTIQNVKITIQLTDRFKNEVKDYTVTITSPDGGLLLFTQEEIENGDAAFINPGTFTVWVQGTRINSGLGVSQMFTIEDSQARDHHAFTIDAHGTGQIEKDASFISVDYSLNDKKQDVIIPGFEEDPIDDQISPVVMSASIENNATAVDPEVSKITISYSTRIQLAANHGITLSNCGNISVGTNGKNLEISVPELNENTEYTLTVPAGAVENRSGSVPVEDALSIIFTTGKKKVIPIKVSGQGVDEPLKYTAETEVEFKMNIEAENGVKALWIEIPSYSETLHFLVEGMQDKKPEGERTKCNLADMSDYEYPFWGELLLGVTSADILDKQQITFNVTGFTSMIPEGEHTMLLTIVDNEDNELNKTVKIIVEP